MLPRGKATKKIILIASAILLFVAGFFAGSWGERVSYHPVNLRENNPEFKFINPLLLSDISHTESLSELGKLKDKLSIYVSGALKENMAGNIGIYFRDLNSGKWTGINEDEKFAPASMLKLITFVASLRKIESDPTLLQRKVALTSKSPDLNIDQNYPPANPVKIGVEYTIEDLLLRMIVESDNNATLLLNEFIGGNSLTKVFDDLKLPPNNAETIYSISPREVSRLLRILYNSTYLSHSLSEQTLDLLSKTNFRKGLVAGVPTTTVVSHKFGERINYDSTDKVVSRELHDCGIIYAEQPYLLCVMTRGESFESLESVISEISKLVWDYGK